MNIKWGFIGAGMVASKALAPAVHAASNATLAAVASQDLNRAQALSPARTYHGVESYNLIITDPDIDAIYINLANHQHHQWAIAALQNGKHVLCEKPLALNLNEAKEMADAANESGKLLIEAAWMRWHPRFQRAVELVRSGSIGELTSIESEFTFTADLKNNFRAQAGGGSLLDVGTYQFQLWRALIDPWISPTLTEVTQDFNESGADLSSRVVAEVKSANGASIKLSFLSSFVAPEQQFAKISGSDNRIEFTKDAAFTSWRQASALQIGAHTEEFAPVDAYQIMIEAVSARISGQDSWVLPIQESLDVAQLIDAVMAFSGARK
jgi:predicted dehydrogenase